MPASLKTDAHGPGSKRRRRAGFSLLEVLVAMTVLSVLVIILASVLSLVSSNWISGAGRTERRQGGRAITAFIQKELAGAMLPINRFADRSIPNLQFLVNPPQVSYRHASALFFQAPLAADATSGDIMAIGYFIRWTSENNVPKATLCRLAVSPADPDFAIYTDLDWVSDAYLDAAAPANATNDYRGFFVDNVIGFWIRCLDEDGIVLTAADETFDSRTAAAEFPAQEPNLDPTEHRLPASVEVSFVTIDARTANRLTPTDQAGIITLVNNAVNAEAFTKSPIIPESIRTTATAYTTRVSMENAR